MLPCKVHSVTTIYFAASGYKNGEPQVINLTKMTPIAREYEITVGDLERVLGESQRLRERFRKRDPSTDFKRSLT